VGGERCPAMEKMFTMVEQMSPVAALTRRGRKG
jgi:hypothetical protein